MAVIWRLLAVICELVELRIDLPRAGNIDKEGITILSFSERVTKFSLV